MDSHVYNARWTFTHLVQAWRHFYTVHGRWPTAADHRTSRLLPTYKTLRTQVGPNPIKTMKTLCAQNDPVAPKRVQVEPHIFLREQHLADMYAYLLRGPRTTNELATYLECSPTNTAFRQALKLGLERGKLERKGRIHRGTGSTPYIYQAIRDDPNFEI